MTRLTHHTVWHCQAHYVFWFTVTGTHVLNRNSFLIYISFLWKVKIYVLQINKLQCLCTLPTKEAFFKGLIHPNPVSEKLPFHQQILQVKQPNRPVINTFKYQPWSAVHPNYWREIWLIWVYPHQSKLNFRVFPFTSHKSFIKENGGAGWCSYMQHLPPCLHLWHVCKTNKWQLSFHFELRWVNNPKTPKTLVTSWLGLHNNIIGYDQCWGNVFQSNMSDYSDYFFTSHHNSSNLLCVILSKKLSIAVDILPS